MIKIDDLYKRFGDTEVLSGINLEIPKGMIYGLAGKSGVGKSTLLRCINGLTPYQQGSIKVDGIEIGKLTERQLREERKNIGMIFQQFSLLERLTVSENIALPMQCWGYDKSEIKKKVLPLLELVGIPEKANAYPSTLSGGQKQRVAIARALSMSPSLLLCDEATSALDPNTATAILALLNDINRQLGITIVFVTHQLFVLKEICDNVAVMEKGKIVDQGSISELYRKNSGALNKLLGKKNFAAPAGQKILKLVYTEQQMHDPVLLNMARTLNCDYLVLDAEKEFNIRQPLGYAVIQISDEDSAQIKTYLDRASVSWNEVNEEEVADE